MGTRSRHYAVCSHVERVRYRIEMQWPETAVIEVDDVPGSHPIGLILFGKARTQANP